nr:MAG TPA: hypothetical protein [Caudoviricetes sp.]
MMIYTPLALRRGGSSYLCSYVKKFSTRLS